jgi:hypothetical protein
LGLILTQYIFYKRAASRPIDSPNIQIINEDPDKPEKPAINYLNDLQLYEREQSFENWYLPENIIIDNTFSQEEKEEIAKIIYKINFPVEKIDDVRFTAVGNFDEFEIEDPAHAIAIYQGNLIVVNRGFTDLADYDKFIAHEIGHLVDQKISSSGFSFMGDYMKIRNIPNAPSDTWTKHKREDFAEVFANLYYSNSDQVDTIYDKDLNNKGLVELLNQLYSYVNYWPDDLTSLNKFNISNSATVRLLSQYETVYLPTDMPYYTAEFWKPTFNEQIQYSNSSSQDAKTGKNCSVLKLEYPLNDQGSLTLYGENLNFINFQMINIELCQFLETDEDNDVEIKTRAEFMETYPNIIEEMEKELNAKPGAINFSDGRSTTHVYNYGNLTEKQLSTMFGQISNKVVELDGEDLGFMEDGIQHRFRFYGYFHKDQVTRFFNSLQKVEIE